MTPEAQRIAIAELCGWYKIDSVTWAPKGWVYGKDVFGALCRDYELPDYLKDLNAMRAAVKTLKDTKRGHYNATLSLVVLNRNLSSTVHEPEWIFDLVNASAGHCAEAFLKVSNKWTG